MDGRCGRVGRGVPFRRAVTGRGTGGEVRRGQRHDLNAVCFEDRDAAGRRRRGRRLLAVRWGTDRHQGTQPGGRVARHRGVRPVSRPGGDAHVVDGRPFVAGAAPCGRSDHRQRVRRCQRQPHRDARRHAQSVAARPHPVGHRAARPGRRRRLVTIATGGDGGGSIRIPAGFTGLVGLKSTYGRIPRGPRARTATTPSSGRWRDRARHRPLVRRQQRTRPTRSVQPSSCRRLGARARHVASLRGARVAFDDWGGAVVSPVMWALLEEAATCDRACGSATVELDTPCRRWAERGRCPG